MENTERNEREKNFPIFRVAEGHGRFMLKTDGEEPVIIFCASDKKIDIGQNDRAKEEPQRVEPVFGMVCQSARKARAIGMMFYQFADRIEQEEELRKHSGPVQ